MSNGNSKFQNLPNDVALYGTVEGKFAFLQVDSGFAQSLLPSDLELAPQSYSPQGQHPMLLLFNRTHLEPNLRLERIAKEYKLGIELNYNEFIVMLPFVQFKDAAYNGGAPYCYLPVLYLDSFLAVLGGRIFWQFNKKFAHFTLSGVPKSINRQFSKAPILFWDFNKLKTQVSDQDCPNFKEIIPILKLPVIEHGIYGYVSSVYTVPTENISIVPINLELDNNGCKYLPFGKMQIRGINESKFGCFGLNYNWTLNYIKFLKI